MCGRKLQAEFVSFRAYAGVQSQKLRRGCGAKSLTGDRIGRDQGFGEENYKDFCRDLEVTWRAFYSSFPAVRTREETGKFTLFCRLSEELVWSQALSRFCWSC